MTIPRHGHRTSQGSGQPNRTITSEMQAAQWRPGQSGNVGGRPKTKPITDALRELMAEEYTGKEERFKGLTNAQVLALRLFEMAEGGDLKALEELATRLEGRAPQAVTMAGENGGPIAFMTLSREDNEKRIAELLALAGGSDRDND
jgi:hypothetical protein